LIRRAAAAQEFGLLIVISLTLIGLTLATPSITTSDFFPQPPGTVVAALDDGTLTVNADGRSKTYRQSDGWSFRSGEDAPILVHQHTVNKFLNKNNLIIVATTASFIAIMAIGMTGIIVMGGIDLSIGSVYAIAAVTGAMALHWLEAAHPGSSGWVSIPLGVGCCCAVGTACGIVNGAATVGLRVHPFIITLGGMAVYRGIAFVTTQGQSIGGFPATYTSQGFKAALFGINPVPTLVMLAVTAAGALFFSGTTFGRRTYAIGGNETAARYAGIPVGRIKIALFAIAGALAGLSAAMMCGYFGGASSGDGSGYELRVIAAAVVGGASLSGGRGSLVGAMLGALLMQLIDNAIVVLGIDSNYTNIVIGLAIVVAVVVDQAKARLTPGSG
jgi:ribose/xylose/arabinose/galactoside ABC-type transport system permease subunit